MEENMQGESSMDEKAFLLQEIRYSKRKQNVKKFLRYESTGIAAGGTIAMVLEAADSLCRRKQRLLLQPKRTTSLR